MRFEAKIERMLNDLTRKYHSISLLAAFILLVGQWCALSMPAMDVTAQVTPSSEHQQSSVNEGHHSAPSDGAEMVAHHNSGDTHHCCDTDTSNYPGDVSADCKSCELEQLLVLNQVDKLNLTTVWSLSELSVKPVDISRSASWPIPPPSPLLEVNLCKQFCLYLI